MGGSSVRCASARDWPLDLGRAPRDGSGGHSHRRPAWCRRAHRRGASLARRRRARWRRDARAPRRIRRTHRPRRCTDEPNRCCVPWLTVCSQRVRPRRRCDSRPSGRRFRRLDRRAARTSRGQYVRTRRDRHGHQRAREDVRRRRPHGSGGRCGRALDLPDGREPSQRRRRVARRRGGNPAWRTQRRPRGRRTLEDCAAAHARHMEASGSGDR